MLVLCNPNGKHLILVNTNSKHIKNIDLLENPWKISIDKESGLAYVTLLMIDVIVNLDTRKFMKQFSCPGKVCGITTMKDGLALGGDRKIYLSSREGDVIKTLNVGKGMIHSLCFQFNTFVCCAANEGMVHIVKTNGDILFSKRIAGMTGPVDITMDNAGLLYIVDYKINTLVSINQDGSLKDVLVDGHGLNKPYALQFSRDFSKLYVSNRGSYEIIVYSCKY